MVADDRPNLTATDHSMWHPVESWRMPASARTRAPERSVAESCLTRSRRRLRRRWPGVSAAARPPKARAAHAGPRHGTRHPHIRTVHPPGSTGCVLGRSFLIGPSSRRPAATSVPPRRGLRPRLRPGHPATTVTTWTCTGKSQGDSPIPGGPAIMDPVQAASSRSVTATAAGTVTGQRGRKDLVDPSSGLTRLAPIREWGRLAWGPLDRRGAGRATYDQLAI